MEVNKTEDVIAKEPETIEELVQEKRSTFEQGITRDNTFIKTMLNSLLRGIKYEEKSLLEACTNEMGILESTAYFLGIYPFVQELHKAIEEYEDWYGTLTKEEAKASGNQPGLFPGHRLYQTAGQGLGGHLWQLFEPAGLGPVSSGPGFGRWKCRDYKAKQQVSEGRSCTKIVPERVLGYETLLGGR